MENAIWGLIGTLVGALTSILTTYLNSKNSMKIQNEQTKSKREEKQSDFQKSNLLKLQELLYNNIRLLTKVYLEDLENYKQNKNWIDSRITKDLDTSVGDSVREIWIYIERTEDTELRNTAKEYANNFSKTLLAKEKNQADFKYMNMMNNFTPLMEQLGEVLRKT